jgi:hypothetical protein
MVHYERFAQSMYLSIVISLKEASYDNSGRVRRGHFSCIE